VPRAAKLGSRTRRYPPGTTGPGQLIDSPVPDRSPPGLTPRPPGPAARTVRPLRVRLPQVTWKRGTELPCRRRGSRRARPSRPRNQRTPHACSQGLFSVAAKSTRPGPAVSPVVPRRPGRRSSSRESLMPMRRCSGEPTRKGRRRTSAPGRPGSTPALVEQQHLPARFRPVPRSAARPASPAPATITSLSAIAALLPRVRFWSLAGYVTPELGQSA